MKNKPECKSAEKKPDRATSVKKMAETADFYRWRVEYTQEKLRHLIEDKLKMELGGIVDLVPIERGASGRISKLKIVGTERTFTIGKDL